MTEKLSPKTYEGKTVDYVLVNSLTCSRALFALGSVAATATGHSEISIALMAIGSMTEFDGTIARAKKVTSLEGNLRDRLADHSFFTLAFIVNAGTLINNWLINSRIDSSADKHSAGFIILDILIAGVFTYWDLKNYRKKLSEINSPSP